MEKAKEKIQSQAATEKVLLNFKKGELKQFIALPSEEEKREAIKFLIRAEQHKDFRRELNYLRSDDESVLAKGFLKESHILN